MLNRLMLKVTKFQLPPPTRLGTVVKNILKGYHAPPPPPFHIELNRYRACKWLRMFEVVPSRLKTAAKVKNRLRSLADMPRRHALSLGETCLFHYSRICIFKFRFWKALGQVTAFLQSEHLFSSYS